MRMRRGAGERCGMDMRALAFVNGLSRYRGAGVGDSGIPRAAEYAFQVYMRGVAAGAGDGEGLSTGAGTSRAGGAGVVSFWAEARVGMKVRGDTRSVLRTRRCSLKSAARASVLSATVGGDHDRGGSSTVVPEVQLDLRGGTGRLVEGCVL